MKTSLARIRHGRSKKDFPFLALEEGEYVELLITRSKVGLILLWIGALAILVLLGSAAATSIGALSRNISLKPEAVSSFWLLVVLLLIIVLIMGLVVSKVYLNNKMFVTNKRIFHFSAQSPFVKSSNIIELSKIEDVSFKQNGIIDHLFHFGTIRLSTVGDETTYTFPLVDTPKDELDLISHLVHIQKK
ncbi:PH domain-containing protein [Candidatus Saccharibacteria bacterium]|nr:PH domain-containing protein [Candidatus Saccharibacteria bacterium]